MWQNCLFAQLGSMWSIQPPKKFRFHQFFIGWLWPYGAQLGKSAVLSHDLGAIWGHPISYFIYLTVWGTDWPELNILNVFISFFISLSLSFILDSSLNTFWSRACIHHHGIAESIFYSRNMTDHADSDRLLGTNRCEGNTNQGDKRWWLSRSAKSV